MRKIILYCIMIGLSAASCRKSETFPVIPAISYMDVTKNYNADGKISSLDLKFSFTDGDGDIGLKQSDTLGLYNVKSPFYYNFYADYLELNPKTGTYVHIYPPPIANDTAHVQFHYRIPYIVPEGKNKTLKGEITVNINAFGLGKKIRFDYFIYDRALHKSNVVSTPEIDMLQ